MDAIAINLRSVAAHERDHKGQGELARLIEAAADEIEALRTCVAEAVAAEREACARIADAVPGDQEIGGENWTADAIAKQIRARSK